MEEIENESILNPVPAVVQCLDVTGNADEETKVKKYLRGEGTNLEVLKDRKLKGQLAAREEVYGKTAKAAAKAEKWLMPSEGGYLKAEGTEKTWRIKQDTISGEVDFLSLRNQYDIVLPDMPPRTVVYRRRGDDNEELNYVEAQQPPPDAASRVLEGMAWLLEQHVGNANRVRLGAVYEQFRKMDPKDFSGTTDPFVAEGWIRSLEGIFKYMDMADADRVHCTICLLKDDASFWWEGVERTVDLNTLTWEGFKRVFYEKYFTVDVRSRLKREFMSLRQGDLSVAEFVKKFDRGCHFVPLIANDAAEKLRHFMDGLRPTICRDVLMVDPTEYSAAVTRAFQAEQALKDIDFEMQRKRQHPQQHQQNKKPYSGPSRF